MDNQNMPPQGSQNPMPSSEQSSPVTKSEGDKSVGALIGSIIIVIILIIGGFYLWNTRVAPVDEMMENGMPVPGGMGEMTPEEQALNQPDPVLSQMAGVSASDETADIDADLKTTNLDGIDSELQ